MSHQKVFRSRREKYMAILDARLQLGESMMLVRGWKAGMTIF